MKRAGHPTSQSARNIAATEISTGRQSELLVLATGSLPVVLGKHKIAYHQNVQPIVVEAADGFTGMVDHRFAHHIERSVQEQRLACEPAKLVDQRPETGV